MKISNQEYIDELLKKSGINDVLDVVIYFEYFKKELKKPHYKKAYDIFRSAYAEQMSLFYDTKIDDKACNTLVKSCQKGYPKEASEAIRENISRLAELFL